jgi:hypothetical protein
VLEPARRFTLEILCWVAGPFVGALLVAIALIGNSGPGFFLFSIGAAGFFTVLMPAVQCTVRRLRRFEDHPIISAIVGFGVVVVLLILASSAVVVNQW